MHEGVFFSPTSSNSIGLTKDQAGQDDISHSGGTSLDEEILVPPAARDVVRHTNPVAGSSLDLTHTREAVPVHQPNTSGLEIGWHALSLQGIQRQVADLILKSRRGSTSSTYERRCRKFCSWCAERDIHPVSAPIVQVLEHLHSLYEHGRAAHSYYSVTICFSCTN